ncbi:MAG: hypothetical protein WCD18_20555 [Thermosynechococcaceae cyanobacterium]
MVRSSKPLGAYLIEAGLLNEAQVGVALADQNTTAMPFGEIVVTRGWVKEQTIEYLMKKVILPERRAAKNTQSSLAEGLARQRPASANPSTADLGSAQSQATPPHSINPKTTTPPRPINPKTTTPPTAPMEEGVNWIG